MNNKRIVIIGAGNVAHHIAGALIKSDLNLCQIYSRSLKSARELGMKTGISFTSEINEVYPDCDIYIFCVSDDALPTVVKIITTNKDALLLHTCGSHSIDIFKGLNNKYGVLYPLQTFSKKRELDFKEVPLCIEGCDALTTKNVMQLAKALSNNTQEVSSEKRRILHLSAVFACNFVNSFYSIAADIVSKEGFDFSILRPLIDETANKVTLMYPKDAQTGPARRGDNSIINLHKSILKKDKDIQELYTLVSNYIRNYYILESKEIDKEAHTDKRAQMPTLW